MDIHDLRYNSVSSFLFFKNSLNKDYFNIYAHKNELFNEHILKTKLIFNNLIDDNVILNFYHYFYNNGFISISLDDFKFIIEDFIFFHDIGKLSFSFQKRLNYNSDIWLEQKNFMDNYEISQYLDFFEANHSLFGALSFIAKYDYLLNENTLLIVILAYSILGHHSSLKDLLFQQGFSYNSFSEKDINTISFLLLFLDISNLDSIQNGDFDQRFFQSIQDKANLNKTPDESYFSFFYNYLYSLLISADVLASREHYKNVTEIQNINFNNRINDKLRLKMNDSFLNINYNKNINEENFLKDLSDVNDINDLRKNMLLESSYNLNIILESKEHSNLFFLNMPTGGGKTNTSMKLALDIINKTNINRIIYAMPFINIIEQNYDIIKDNFCLDESLSEIRKIYSATETIFQDQSDEFKSKIILQDDFFNYPVICTTFFSFFESILRTNKKYKYKISAFANSVVILDEIQSLPLLNWNSLYYIINEIAKHYNIYFIIMSATLPKFNKLKIHDESEYGEPLHLIKNPELYFDHYLFNRNTISKNIQEISIDDKKVLKDYLLNEIIFPNFDLGYSKGLIVLNTIRSSKIVFDILNECDDFELELLNSSLLPYVKQKIIYKVNNMGREKSKKFILISTQTIEAGVDVSFDFVVRDFAILDSIEQVRGRCNRSRELNKINPNLKGNVYLINLKNNKKYLHEYIYNEYELNSRILETKKILNKNLNYNYFDMLEYYDAVSRNINNLEDEKNETRRFNDKDNIIRWNNLEYSKLNEKDGIHIIDNLFDQYSFFIPITMKIFVEDIREFNYEFSSDSDLKDIYDEYEKNFIFSYNELKYLKSIELTSSYNIIKGNCIDGEELIKFYEELLEESIDDFSKYKIIKKEFSSIINKFLVNISINNEEILDKVVYEFKKIDYFYIIEKDYLGDNEDSLYSISRGLNDYPQFTEIL